MRELHSCQLYLELSLGGLDENGRDSHRSLGVADTRGLLGESGSAQIRFYQSNTELLIPRVWLLRWVLHLGDLVSQDSVNINPT